MNRKSSRSGFLSVFFISASVIAYEIAVMKIFSVGNYGKVVPCTRFESREINAGPVYHEARTRYFAFAESARVF